MASTLPVKSEAVWFVYLVRAQNGALYCGTAKDPIKRFAQHQKGLGARFFRVSPAEALVYTERCMGRSQALRREHAIRQLSKAVKERMLI